jgi:hypothetical protein
LLEGRSLTNERENYCDAQRCFSFRLYDKWVLFTVLAAPTLYLLVKRALEAPLCLKL